MSSEQARSRDYQRNGYPMASLDLALRAARSGAEANRIEAYRASMCLGAAMVITGRVGELV